MFTGLIEETGSVRSIRHGSASARITVSARKITEGTLAGDSIAVNGVCLTVRQLVPGGFTADVMTETLARSTLGELTARAAVNLERALASASAPGGTRAREARFGGHLVTGHIDGTGLVSTIKNVDIARIIEISCRRELLRYIVEKGSVALDGVSLTVCDASLSGFSVSIIPHTFAHTTLAAFSAGTRVNIECDIIGKYAQKTTEPARVNNSPKTVITEGFLRENGFLEE